MSKKIKEILQSLNTSPKKSLGQNFLINEGKINKIVDEICSKNYNSVIEIGPGLGAITDMIARLNQYMVCIEKDPTLYSYLKKKYEKNKNFKILNKDILKCDLKEIGTGSKLFFGNLPYNIGTKIIENFVDNFFSNSFSTGIFMLQKEVGDKILSDKGSKLYNGFVVKINTFYKVSKIIDLNESDFWPQPKVKSVLIKLENRNKIFSKVADYKEYTNFLFNCFRVRRKKLTNNLHKHYSKELITKSLRYLKLKENIRAQDIDYDIFTELFDILKENKS